MVIFHSFLYVYHRVKPDEVVHGPVLFTASLHRDPTGSLGLCAVSPNLSRTLIKSSSALGSLTACHVAFDQWGISNQVLGDQMNH
jgi:hypothetical protein